MRPMSDIAFQPTRKKTTTVKGKVGPLRHQGVGLGEVDGNQEGEKEESGKAIQLGNKGGAKEGGDREGGRISLGPWKRGREFQKVPPEGFLKVPPGEASPTAVYFPSQGVSRTVSPTLRTVISEKKMTSTGQHAWDLLTKIDDLVFEEKAWHNLSPRVLAPESKGILQRLFNVMEPGEEEIRRLGTLHEIFVAYLAMATHLCSYA
ncbi:hypothetical protein C8R47DRAFT_296617 [Mycena vitilis]|nr:hypothetical protein C8R47DRAFT_296617 [Mycena vitilis]